MKRPQSNGAGTRIAPVTRSAIPYVLRSLILLGMPLAAVPPLRAQTLHPPSRDARIYDLVQSVSAERIEHDIGMLAGFGTRNTYRTRCPTRAA